MSFPNTAARFARSPRTKAPRNGSTGQVAARGLTAADVMTRKLITLAPDTPVQEAIGTLLKNRISGAPVVGPGRSFLGVFSEKICMRVLLDAAAEQVPCCGTVGQYADADAQTVTEDTPLLTMVHLFNEGRFRRLPVLRHDADGRAEVVGQVSRRDVLWAAYDLGTFRPARETPHPLYLSGVRAADDAVPV
ncbi:CBS domain-containing protein [Alienimonas sp. DA493]|uniref:CBS domain-containing protein n=1 Tax=Alienimonas sp. DA493 TaxID=3373605 RepID=UPI00375403B0